MKMKHHKKQISSIFEERISSFTKSTLCISNG